MPQTLTTPPYAPRLLDRLLPMLQLTRMALVFTALADSACELLLRAAAHSPPGARVLDTIDWRRAVAVALISIGLYGFGMSLNDIIDRRRDRQISPGRPLPSGRIGLTSASLACLLLALLAVAGGTIYARWTPAGIAAGLRPAVTAGAGWRAALASVLPGWPSLFLVLWTGLLIFFYDAAGKYLVWPGLLTLGLIRFFHAAIAAPELPLLWHPLFLLDHVAILSAVAYAWEEKRPPLTRAHRLGVGLGLAFINLAAVGMVAWRHYPRGAGDGPVALTAAGIQQALAIDLSLLWPLAAAAWFVVLGAYLRRTCATRREAGQKLMLYGLLWLIVYDAAFAGGYVGWRYGVVLLLLLPVAYVSVQLMRWASRLTSLSNPPQYVRAGTGAKGGERREG